MFLWKPFVFSSPFRRFGIAGLYKGLEAKLLQTVLTAALMFLVYEKLTAATFMVMGLKSTRKHWDTSHPRPRHSEVLQTGASDSTILAPPTEKSALAGLRCIWGYIHMHGYSQLDSSSTHCQLSFFDGWLSLVEEVGPMAIWKAHTIENLKMKLDGDLLIFLKGMDYCCHV